MAKIDGPPTIFEVTDTHEGLNNDYTAIVQDMSIQPGTICVTDNERVKKGLVRALIRHKKKSTGNGRYGHFTLQLEPEMGKDEFGNEIEVRKWAITIRLGKDDDYNPLPDHFPTEWMAEREETSYGRWKEAAAILAKNGKIEAEDKDCAHRIAVAFRHYHKDANKQIKTHSLENGAFELELRERTKPRKPYVRKK